MNSNLSSITQKKQYLKSYRSTRCLIQILESEIFNFQSLSFESSYILHPVEGTDTYANYSLYRAQVDTLIFKLQSQRLGSGSLLSEHYSVHRNGYRSRRTECASFKIHTWRYPGSNR